MTQYFQLQLIMIVSTEKREHAWHWLNFNVQINPNPTEIESVLALLTGDIRYFWLKDKVEKGEISVKYCCPTELMIADFWFLHETNRGVIQKTEGNHYGTGQRWRIQSENVHCPKGVCWNYSLLALMYHTYRPKQFLVYITEYVYIPSCCTKYTSLV